MKNLPQNLGRSESVRPSVTKKGGHLTVRPHVNKTYWESWPVTGVRLPYDDHEKISTGHFCYGLPQDHDDHVECRVSPEV